MYYNVVCRCDTLIAYTRCVVYYNTCDVNGPVSPRHPVTAYTELARGRGTTGVTAVY